MNKVMTRPAIPAAAGAKTRAARVRRADAAATADQGGNATGAGLAGIQRIVVGVDDSAGGLTALRWAVGQAGAASVPLVAVRSWALGLPRHGGRRYRRLARAHPHVLLRFDGSEQPQGAGEIVRRSFGIPVGGTPRDVTVTVQTPEGDPGRALTGLAAAEGDLLVVGRESARGLRRLVHGSVSGYCGDHARCPVVIISAADADMS